ncbi:peptidoglycan-recognition protein LC-like isoform X1 [Anopheles darlingi]|uniref:peptidoglycan-recognition protein LC-like isoform X1 n=1 Tax=Anopheles darlingi TaxID=43151 RepID=UPI00210022C3|nr:peptidoglycan-recognition protein LC-like isoform X1 [Anopheles darlingi]
MAKVKHQETDNQVTPSSDGTTETQPPSADVDGAHESNVGTVCAMTNTTDSTRGSLSNISMTSNNHTNNVDDDSSAFDSSSDTECDDDSIKRVIDQIPKELRSGECEIRDGALKIGPQAINSITPAMRSPPTIGSIALQNSSDITFGNKTYIKGQVVIKNIYKDRQNGYTNGAYENDACEMVADNSTKKDPSTLSPSQPKSWQSNIKAIIKDKPLLSSFLIILLICFLCAVIAIICVLAATGKTIFRPTIGDGDDDRLNVPPNKDIEDDLFPDPKPLRLVTRTEWLAQPPREVLTDLKLPVNNVIIAHTATEGCTTQSKCMFQVKLIQDFHIMPESRNFSDIAYQFLVGGDGNAYEGRGWLKQGAHTKGFNVDSICIAFVGTFIKYKPPIAQLSAAQQLIKMGLDNNYIAHNFSLYGHRQLAPFESPGQALYDIIKTWPHWSDKLGSDHWKPPDDQEGSRRRKRNAITDP